VLEDYPEHFISQKMQIQHRYRYFIILFCSVIT